MDTIFIRDLEVTYYIGVTDKERSSPQRLLLTIAMSCNVAEAAAADDLNCTVDYFAVAQRLLGYGQGRSWKLIERLAVEIAFLVLREFRVASVSVEVKKFVIPEAAHVAVQVTRTQAQAAGTNQ